MERKYWKAIGVILIIISIIQLICYALGLCVLLAPIVALFILVIGIALVRGREVIKNDSEKNTIENVK